MSTPSGKANGGTPKLKQASVAVPCSDGEHAPWASGGRLCRVGGGQRESIRSMWSGPGKHVKSWGFDLTDAVRNRGNSLIGRASPVLLRRRGEFALRLRLSLVKMEDGEMQGHFGVVDKVPVLSRLAPASKRVLVLSGSLRITEQPCVMWEHHGYQRVRCQAPAHTCSTHI